MIDWRHETVLSLAQAAAQLPPVRGRPVNPSTVWRWAMRGRGGRRLETILVGGTRCTSAEALQRFFELTPENKETQVRSRTQVSERLAELLRRPTRPVA